MDSARATTEDLKIKITQASLPEEVSEKLLNLLQFPGSGAELSNLVTYINFVISLPFNKYSQDILDINRSKQILDKNHYGLQSVKDRILEYLAVLILHKTQGDRSFVASMAPQDDAKRQFHAPILAFIGLVGTGKTSLAYSI